MSAILTTCSKRVTEHILVGLLRLRIIGEGQLQVYAANTYRTVLQGVKLQLEESPLMRREHLEGKEEEEEEEEEGLLHHRHLPDDV